MAWYISVMPTTEAVMSVVIQPGKMALTWILSDTHATACSQPESHLGADSGSPVHEAIDDLDVATEMIGQSLLGPLRFPSRHRSR